MELTDRYNDALNFAESLHRDQKRKGTRIPYLSHLLAVSALVMEYGGDEKEAIAALLHAEVLRQVVNTLSSLARVRELSKERGRNFRQFSHSSQFMRKN